MSDLKLFETYKIFLKKYSLEQIRHIPEQEEWSIGHMYDHPNLIPRRITQKL